MTEWREYRYRLGTILPSAMPAEQMPPAEVAHLPD